MDDPIYKKPRWYTLYKLRDRIKCRMRGSHLKVTDGWGFLYCLDCEQSVDATTGKALGYWVNTPED